MNEYGETGYTGTPEQEQPEQVTYEQPVQTFEPAPQPIEPETMQTQTQAEPEHTQTPQQGSAGFKPEPPAPAAEAYTAPQQAAEQPVYQPYEPPAQTVYTPDYTAPGYTQSYTDQQMQAQQPPQMTVYPPQVQYPQPEPPKAKKEKKKRKFSMKQMFAACLIMAFVVGTGSGILGVKLASLGSSSLTSGKAVLWNATNTPLSTSSEGETMTAAEIAAATANSVVEITTEQMQTGSLFQQYVTSGAGSGVIISEDGYIVTNHHVIDGASKIKVTLKNGDSYDATVVGSDEKTDIAVLKIDASSLTPAVFGDSDSLVVGETVVAIGNPLGQLGGTVTEGIISALDREVTIDGQAMRLLQTSASINPGNSGGGLFNTAGQLIGITNAKSSGSDIEGLGFAIPANTAKSVIEDIIEHGYVKGRAQLNITTVNVGDLQAAMSYGVNELGLYVYSVNAGSNAEKAGLQRGDRIAAADGTEISSYSDLNTILEGKSVGDSIELEVSRNGQRVTISITLEEYSPNTTTDSADF